jgi:hypothetical protein
MRVSLPVLFVLSGISFISVRSFAGPMPACVAATLSANHHVLVTNDFTSDDPNETRVRKVTGSVFRVFQELKEPNAGTRITGPEKYWGFGPAWSVHFPSEGSPEIIACPYVFVTDDAEFLVLVMNLPSKTALRIYRRREHPGQRIVGTGPDTGVLVKAISLDEIIPPPSSALASVITDHTPQWYSSGEFTFLENNRTLVYRDKAIGSVRIDLATGTIFKEDGSRELR